MVRFWLALAAGALAIPLLPFAILGDLPGPEWLEGHPTYTFVVGVFLLGSDILLPIPSSLVAVALGAKLGPWPGALAVFLGLSSAALIGYLLGWHIGYRAVSAFASPRQLRAMDELERGSSYFVLALCRSVPVLAEASVVAAGAARLPARPVLTTVLAANCLLAILYCWLGAMAVEERSPALLLIGGILVPGFGFLLIQALMRIRRGVSTSAGRM